MGIFNQRTKPFPKSDPNPEHNWELTATAMGLLAISGTTSRKNSLVVMSDQAIVSARHHEHDVVAFVQSSDQSSPPYLVGIDFLRRQMSCECRAFAHREGPCKHLVALAATTIHLREGGDKTPREWIKAAVMESRNAALQKKPWEEKPSFDEAVAEEHGAMIATVSTGRRKVTGYSIDGKLWTGPLPLPLPGERILVHLPTGERTGATVIEHDFDHMLYYGLMVELDDAPQHYYSNTITIFGSEVERTEEMISAARRARFDADTGLEGDAESSQAPPASTHSF